MNETKIEPITEKLDDKIAKLNSSRVYKKVTPKGDLSWYIKWVATVFILVAAACRSVEEVPRIYDVVFTLIGTMGWFTVGLLWHDRALVFLNGAIITLLFGSILRHIFGG